MLCSNLCLYTLFIFYFTMAQRHKLQPYIRVFSSPLYNYQSHEKCHTNKLFSSFSTSRDEKKGFSRWKTRNRSRASSDDQKNITWTRMCNVTKSWQLRVLFISFFPLLSWPVTSSGDTAFSSASHVLYYRGGLLIEGTSKFLGSWWLLWEYQCNFISVFSFLTQWPGQMLFGWIVPL